MNICFLEGDMSRKGGTERMTAFLANALCAGHQVWVISLRLHGGEVFFELDPRVRHVTLRAAAGKAGIPAQISEIHRFLRHNRMDRVINVDVGMGFYGILAAVGTKAKVITWEHGNYFNNWGSRVFPHLRRFAARHSDAMVVLTEQDRENYRSHISRCAPVHVIPNPAEPHAFTYDSASATILSAGLLLPIKGFSLAVEAARRLLPDRPEWKWVICGEGPERAQLERLICEAGLEKQILLPGTVRDMDRQYQDAALFVMTSEMEGLPMVLLEAKSWGLPLVSFDIMTGPRDIIEDGVNGYLVPAADAAALAEKLAVLMDHRELRSSFSQQSQRGMEKFARERIVADWQKLLERT
ncbi:MAG: glycosyltransferase family 4 protein [Eubacteriales bacterium]